MCEHALPWGTGRARVGRCVAWDAGSHLGASPGMPHNLFTVSCPAPAGLCLVWDPSKHARARARAHTHERAQAPGAKAPGGQEEAVPHGAAASSPVGPPCRPWSDPRPLEGAPSGAPTGGPGFGSQRQPPGTQASLGAGAAELRTWLPQRPRPSAQESLGAQLGECCCFQAAS